MGQQGRGECRCHHNNNFVVIVIATVVAIVIATGVAIMMELLHDVNTDDFVRAERTPFYPQQAGIGAMDDIISW
jgi:hypothetical protein